MTPRQATAPPLNTGVTRLLRSSFRVILAVVVLVAVCLAWLVLFLLFLPFLLLAGVARFFKSNGNELDSHEITDVTASARKSDSKDPVSLIFDRRNDVSKLYGCNTRNVRYRWQLFKKRLEGLQLEFEHPTALDFGAGSLRDTHELARCGFKVIAFDLNQIVLNHYFESYDWTTTTTPPMLTSGLLEDLTSQNQPDSVQLIIAFDVIEHLHDPASYVRAFSRILCERGFLFTIVPNKRSLFERYFKRSLAQQIKHGVVPEPGVPHIQFKSPEEWDEFFQSNGFHIIDRDMAIGHFVNDWWNGLLSIPLRAYVYPVVTVLAFRLGREIDPGRLERLFCPPWLMKHIDSMDLLFQRLLKARSGWNLIVAQRSN